MDMYLRKSAPIHTYVECYLLSLLEFAFVYPPRGLREWFADHS